MGWIERIRARRRHGAGWRPDAPDSRDYDFDRLAAPSASRTAYSLRDYCPPVYDQGRTNSCVAQAFAGAIEIREQMSGEMLHPMRPSRLFMYWQARAAHDATGRDKGTYLRLCAKMLNRLGVPGEAHWPFFPGKVNRRPSWNAHMRAHPRMGGKYVRIMDSAGQGRIDAIRAAVQGGYPVAFGTNIDTAFTRDYGDRVITQPLDPSVAIGGHAMLIVGFEYDDHYGYIFDVRNSWGERWRDHGYSWMTEDYINDSASRDFQIIDGWARIQGDAR